MAHKGLPDAVQTMFHMFYVPHGVTDFLCYFPLSLRVSVVLIGNIVEHWLDLVTYGIETVKGMENVGPGKVEQIC